MGDNRIEDKGDRRREEFGAYASEGVLLEYLSADLQKERHTRQGEQWRRRATADSHQAHYPWIEANYQDCQEEGAGRERLVASWIEVPIILLPRLIAIPRCRKVDEWVNENETLGKITRCITFLKNAIDVFFLNL